MGSGFYGALKAGCLSAWHQTCLMPGMAEIQKPADKPKHETDPELLKKDYFRPEETVPGEENPARNLPK